MRKRTWTDALPQLALERSSSDALLRRYVYGSDLVSMTTSAGAFYVHEDGLGSVQSVTNASGVKQWTYVYEPFGLKRTETKNGNKAPVNPMQFTGEYLDAAPGLYHLRARQYDPAVGRFSATDPLPPTLSKPYLSSYVYADNRPTTLIDPSGWGAESARAASVETGCGRGGVKNELRCIGEFFGDGNVTISTCVGVCLGGALDGSQPYFYASCCGIRPGPTMMWAEGAIESGAREQLSACVWVCVGGTRDHGDDEMSPSFGFGTPGAAYGPGEYRRFSLFERR